MEKIIIMSLLLSLATSVARGEALIEIGRVAGTSSIHAHYNSKQKMAKKKRLRRQQMSLDDWLTDLLPIHTDNMRVGDVVPERRAFSQLMLPIFVIGADRRSLNWLRDNREVLIAHQAVGMLVEVETLAQIKAIGEAGRGLTISPVSGDDLAEQLALSHYPVLISQHGIEQ